MGRKSKLSKWYPDICDRCDLCARSPANLSHMFWTCPKLHHFWTYFFETISLILGIEIQPCAEIAIFGVPGSSEPYTCKQLDIIAFTSLLARRRILLLWKSSSPPSSASLLEDLMSFIKLEKIKFTVRGSVQKFYSTWQPLLSYFDGLSALPPD